MAVHLRAHVVDRMTNEIGLSEVVSAPVDLLEGRLRGRTVVNPDR